MTISQFFDVYPWIRISTFARCVGINEGLLRRIRDDLQEPDEYVVEQLNEYVSRIGLKMIEKPLTHPPKKAICNKRHNN